VLVASVEVLLVDSIGMVNVIITQWTPFTCDATSAQSTLSQFAGVENGLTCHNIMGADQEVDIFVKVESQRGFLQPRRLFPIRRDIQKVLSLAWSLCGVTVISLSSAETV
jgi:hypothetical protein